MLTTNYVLQVLIEESPYQNPSDPTHPHTIYSDVAYLIADDINQNEDVVDAVTSHLEFEFNKHWLNSDRVERVVYRITFANQSETFVL